MSVYAFNSLPNVEYSNLFNVAAFSSESFSCKTSLPVKNSYVLTLPDNKAEILAVFLPKSCRALFCSILVSTVLNFSLILVFIINSS